MREGNKHGANAYNLDPPSTFYRPEVPSIWDHIQLFEGTWRILET